MSSSATGCMRLAGLLAAAAAASYVPTVAAQGENLMLEEIVVTVRRRVEMEQDVPISMKAMDSEFIRKQNINELADLGIKVPAVRLSNAGTSTNEPIVTIRGQRPTDTALGLDQAAPIYLNEVVMTPAQGTNLGLYDLENIQVLKGPQGTLFGRNSTGGAILLSSKRPGVEFGGYAQVEAGNYGLKTFEGAVDVPANDMMQFRVAGRVVQRDGYQDNVADNELAGKEKFWDEDSQAIRVTMNLDLDVLTNMLIASYAQNEMASRIPIPTAFNDSAFGAAAITSFPFPGFADDFADAVDRQNSRDPWEIEADVNAEEKVTDINVANITEFDLTDDISFKSVLGYRRMKHANSQEADGTAVPIFGSRTVFPTAPGVYPATLNPEQTMIEAEQYSIELQLVGDSLDGALEWIGGVYAYEMDGSSYYPIQQNPILIQNSPAGDVVNTAFGIFGEGTYTFNDEFSLTLGLRQSWDDREVTVKNESLDANPMSPTVGQYLCAVLDEDGDRLPLDGCARTESEEFSSPTGRISLNYTPSEGMLAYFSVSSGYRAGGFNMRGTTNDSLQPFDEETVITYEIGHKADWGLAGVAPLRTNIAAYYQDYSDIQKTQSIIDTATGSFGTQTINAAEAVIRGVEFDVTWALTENLRTSFGYAYTDTYYKDWMLPVIDFAQGGIPVDVDASGSDFTYVPEHSATFSVTYDLPVDLSLGEMSVMLSGYWQSDMVSHATGNLFDDEYAPRQFWTPDNLELAQSTIELDSYSVWNFRYDWRNIMESSFDAALWVNNLTDEEYAVGGLNVIDLLGFAATSYGAPRTFGVNVRYTF